MLIKFLKNLPQYAYDLYAYKLKDISGQSKGKINQFDKISFWGMNYKDRI